MNWSYECPPPRENYEWGAGGGLRRLCEDVVANWVDFPPDRGRDPSQRIEEGSTQPLTLQRENQTHWLFDGMLMFDAHLPASLPSHSTLMSSAINLTSPAYVPTSHPSTFSGKEQVPSVTVLDLAKLE